MGDFIPLSEVANISSGKRPLVISKTETAQLTVPVIGGGGCSGFTDKALFGSSILITGRVGTLGKLFVSDTPCWPSDNALVIFPSSDDICYDFLKYSLQARIADAAGMNRGAANPLITQKDLGTLEVFFVPLSEQRAIAAILSALDDKIDLNRRMNATLEAMARALFRDWFVTFGPTRAKMGLSAKGAKNTQTSDEPCLAPEIWSLFPDRLDDEGMPEGWEVSNLGKHTVNFDRKRVPLSKKERAIRQGKYPYHGATGVMDYVDDFLFDGVFVLVGEDGSVEKEKTGLAFTQYVWGQFWVNNHAHVLQGKDTVSTEQVLMHFQHEPVSPFITGAVQLKLSQGRMNSMPFVFPGDNLCIRFGQAAGPIFARIRANDDESRTLAQTRDLLLPRLMSGEIRLREAEQIAEEVL